MKRRGLLELANAAPLLLMARAAQASRDHSGLRASVGPPQAPHAMPGGDAQRSRRAPSTLAAAPRVEQRLRIALGIGRGLVTRKDGSLFVLHPSARASSFDSQGKLLHSLKLPAEASGPPVVTSDGAVAFLAFGELLVVDERGRIRSHTPLGETELSARSILGARDGGLLLATGSWLIKLSAFGELSFRKSIAETPLELLETSVGPVCVTISGSVQRLDAAGRLTKLGELGAATAAVTASADATMLFARTGNHRLVSFDLDERRLRASIEDATLELDGPVLLSRESTAQVFTSDGLLVRYRPDGSEAQRLPVDSGARKPPGPDDALLLSDGRLLLARAGADAVLVTPTGEVSTIASSACPDPIGLFAAGPRHVLLACRSGNLLVLA
ncbi:MAG TPA: hypothetical protein VJN18_16750 [Polyangiaceae bacterium]|nr:hypothetical protein [Polyangiaceae bacterium]